jgi:large subunit ribosomal protein L10
VRKAEKQDLIDSLEETVREHAHIILTTYRGLSVKDMNELRRAVRGAGGRMQVVKNRLFARALGEADQAGLKEHLTGPVAATFVMEAPTQVLKEMHTFARTHEELAFRAGWVEGELLNGEQLSELATLPPRDELLSKLVASLGAPLSQLVTLLQAVPRDLVLTLQGVVKQRESAEAA